MKFPNRAETTENLKSVYEGALKETEEQLDIDDAKQEFLKEFSEYLASQPKIHHDNSNLLKILPNVLVLQNTKESAYGRSYCKHGDMSIFFNLERKWDRIQNIMEGVMKSGTDTLYDSSVSGTPTETILDTLVDLGIYSLLWVGYMAETHPELWENFKNQNQIELRRKKINGNK